jgi:hypothetical protein
MAANEAAAKNLVVDTNSTDTQAAIHAGSYVEVQSLFHSNCGVNQLRCRRRTAELAVEEAAELAAKFKLNDIN